MWRDDNALGLVAIVVHNGRLVRAWDVQDADIEDFTLYILGGVFHREHCPDPARAVQICS